MASQTAHPERTEAEYRDDHEPSTLNAMRRVIASLAVLVAACALAAGAAGSQRTAPGNCYAKLGSKVVSIVCPAKIKTTLLPSFA